MTWTFIAHRGSGNNKVSGTTLTFNPTDNINVGQICLVLASSDNYTTVDNTETTQHTITDSKGNTWSKIKEKTKTSGSAADGVTHSSWWSKITTQILTTDTIQLTLANAVTSKCLGAFVFSITGSAVSLVGANSTVGTGTTLPSTTLSDLTSAEYLWVGSIGTEGPNGDTFTQDGDYANNTSFGTTGSSAAGNVSCRFGSRIYTGTTDTYNPTLGTARDCVDILGALKETVPPTKKFTAETFLIKSGVTEKFIAEIQLVKRPLTKAFATETQVAKRISKTLTTESYLVKRTTKVFAAETQLVKRPITKIFVAESQTVKRQSKTLIAEIALKATGITKTFITESQTVKRRDKAFAAETQLVKRPVTKSFTTEIQLTKRILKTFITETQLINLKTKTFTEEIQIVNRKQKTFTAEVYLIISGAPTKSFVTETQLVKRIAKSFIGESQLIERITKPFTGESQTVKRNIKRFTAETNVGVVIVEEMQAGRYSTAILGIQPHIHPNFFRLLASYLKTKIS